MMLRPPVAVALFSFAGLGITQAAGHDPSREGLTLVAVLVLVAAWFVNATVLNDLADEDIDRVNLADARGRPLVSGDATRAELRTLGRGLVWSRWPSASPSTGGSAWSWPPGWRSMLPTRCARYG